MSVFGSLIQRGKDWSAKERWKKQFEQGMLRNPRFPAGASIQLEILPDEEWKHRALIEVALKYPNHLFVSPRRTTKAGVFQVTVAKRAGYDANGVSDLTTNQMKAQGFLIDAAGCALLGSEIPDPDGMPFKPVTFGKASPEELKAALEALERRKARDAALTVDMGKNTVGQS